MPRTKPQPPLVTTMLPTTNGPMCDVLTLGETAVYLRLPEEEVLRMVREQELPARQVGMEWRFHKNALQKWLSQPLSVAKKRGIWAFAGVWKDDPNVEVMLKDIYVRRGRSMIEET